MSVATFRSHQRGAVYKEDAYAQGKMLDHSSWSHGPFPLPRGITPSDIDMVCDNAGRILLVEISSSKRDWRELDRGQRLAYINAISGTRHIAVLCSHNVPKTRMINTRLDIETFQAIFFVGDNLLCSDLHADNQDWQQFVLDFYADPDAVRRYLINCSSIRRLS